MKKILLSFVLFSLTVISSFAQIECNENYSNTLDANGEAELMIIDLVPNIEFLLTQGTVSYFVFPWTTGEITSSSDVIPLTCDNRGLPSYIIELTSGGSLVENCTGTMVITSPNGGCPGDEPDFCGDNPDCLKIISGFFVLNDSPSDIFAIDYALCEEAIGCGTYSIAYGFANQGSSLNFTNSISTGDATSYENPVTIFYTDGSTTVFLQSYLYVWSNADCLLKSDFETVYELDLTAEAEITPDNFVTSEVECESLGLAITDITDPEPINYTTSLTVNCDNIGQRKVWVKNLETDYVVAKTIQVRDPLEACGTVLGDGDRLVSFTKSIEGSFFNTNIEVNGKILPRHPGGIGYILNEDDLIDGTNTLHFISDDFSLNGVSSFDLVLGHRIILSDEYDHPRESVLFDIDMGGYNGIGDLITMKEVILGVDDGDGIPDSYFFNNSFEFSADFDPFNFENNFTEFSFDKSDFDIVDLSFEGYKVGDLNQTAVPGLQEEKMISETRSDGATIQVNDMEITAGEEFTFEMKCKSGDKFVGLLTALIGDGIEFISLDDDALNSVHPRVDFNIPNKNEIRIMYREESLIAKLDEITFTITAIASKDGILVDMLGLKSGFPHEIVGDNSIINSFEEITVVTTSVLPVGLEEKVSIYPNPANVMITLSAEDVILKNVSIVNALGKQVLNKDLNESTALLDVSGFASGIYHVRITTENGIQTQTFVKE